MAEPVRYGNTLESSREDKHLTDTKYIKDEKDGKQLDEVLHDIPFDHLSQGAQDVINAATGVDGELIKKVEDSYKTIKLQNENLAAYDKKVDDAVAAVSQQSLADSVRMAGIETENASIKETVAGIGATGTATAAKQVTVDMTGTGLLSANAQDAMLENRVIYDASKNGETYADFATCLATVDGMLSATAKKYVKQIFFMSLDRNIQLYVRKTQEWVSTAVSWLPISTKLVNDLTTGGADVPLSAEQGKILSNRTLNMFAKVGGDEMLEPEWTIGKFISHTGAVVSSSQYKYSAPILVNAGNTITIKATTFNNVSAISKMLSEGQTYEPLVLSTSNTETNESYTYTNKTAEKIYVSVSGKIADGIEVTVTNQSSFIDKTSIVNDLTTGGEDVPLSAEQGKMIAGSLSEIGKKIEIFKLTVGKYVGTTGVITSGGTSWGATDYINVKPGDVFNIYTKTDTVVMAVAYYDSSKKFISSISVVGEADSGLKARTIYVPDKYNIAYAVFTSYMNGLSGYYVKRIMVYSDVINELRTNLEALSTSVEKKADTTAPYIHGDILAKPFSFNGRTATFTGDSITVGFTSGSGTTTENMVKKFCTAVGLTYTTRAIGGAAITNDLNDVNCILEQLQASAITSDYLFILAGVNDCQLGASATVFEAGVKAICDYLQANYTGIVIFVTPINYTKVFPAQILPIEYYRSAITKIAIQYGYNIVDGGSIVFPTATGDEAKLLTGDGLHPTELGYTLYAKSLQAKLC